MITSHNGCSDTSDTDTGMNDNPGPSPNVVAEPEAELSTVKFGSRSPTAQVQLVYQHSLAAHSLSLQLLLLT